jgi:hypothetical protein
MLLEIEKEQAIDKYGFEWRDCENTVLWIVDKENNLLVHEMEEGEYSYHWDIFEEQYHDCLNRGVYHRSSGIVMSYCDLKPFHNRDLEKQLKEAMFFFSSGP